MTNIISEFVFTEAWRVFLGYFFCPLSTRASSIVPHNCCIPSFSRMWDMHILCLGDTHTLLLKHNPLDLSFLQAGVFFCSLSSWAKLCNTLVHKSRYRNSKEEMWSFLCNIEKESLHKSWKGQSLWDTEDKK